LVDLSDSSNKFRFPALRRQDPGQKKQIACLHRFDISAERLIPLRQLDAKFFQSLAGAGRPETLRRLPFANVCTAVDVQHLSRYLMGFR
jgi:hypothetical protein